MRGEGGLVEDEVLEIGLDAVFAMLIHRLLTVRIT